MDVEVEDVVVELWAGWLGRRRGDAAGRARRNAAELAEAMAERNVERWKGEWRVRGVHPVRGNLWMTLGLTGGASTAYGRQVAGHAAAGNVLSN